MPHAKIGIPSARANELDSREASILKQPVIWCRICEKKNNRSRKLSRSPFLHRLRRFPKTRHGRCASFSHPDCYCRSRTCTGSTAKLPPVRPEEAMTGHGLTAANSASIRSMAETLPITVGGELRPAPKDKQLFDGELECCYAFPHFLHQSTNVDWNSTTI